MGSHGCSDGNGEDKNTKAKRPFKGGEGENHENTGSTAPAPAARLRFCGRSPTTTEPSGCYLPPLAEYGCPMGGKGLQDGQQVYMPNMAKNMAKNCQKTHKIDRKSSKRHLIWPMRFFFPTFRPKSVILRGRNMLQLRKQEPEPNSAPNFRRLPEKLLKTVLIHQDDHHRPKRR